MNRRIVVAAMAVALPLTLLGAVSHAAGGAQFVKYRSAGVLSAAQVSVRGEQGARAPGQAPRSADNARALTGASSGDHPIPAVVFTGSMTCTIEGLYIFPVHLFLSGGTHAPPIPIQVYANLSDCYGTNGTSLTQGGTTLTGGTLQLHGTLPPNGSLTNNCLDFLQTTIPSMSGTITYRHEPGPAIAMSFISFTNGYMTNDGRDIRYFGYPGSGGVSNITGSFHNPSSSSSSVAMVSDWTSTNFVAACTSPTGMGFFPFTGAAGQSVITIG